MNPVALVERLEAIEVDLADRLPALERAAYDWHVAKRDKEKAWAVAFLAADGSVEARKAEASVQTATDGKLEEASYESLRAVVRVLEARASIGQTLVRVNGRTV